MSIFFTTDEDNDGVFDNNDNLLYSENEVSATGIDLNILINGQTTNNNFFGTKDVNFYDGETILMNFDFNFDKNVLDLNKIIIIKNINGLVVDLNGQLQSDYNKTLYITNNNFESLCVKNAPISSLSDISSTCTDLNEYDFTTCLSGNYSTDGINCTLSNGIIKVENLLFSGILGTPYPQTNTGSSSSCTPLWTCTNWSECIDGNQTRLCTKTNNCGTALFGKPIETRNCTIKETTENDSENNEVIIDIISDEKTDNGADTNKDGNSEIIAPPLIEETNYITLWILTAGIVLLVIVGVAYYKKDDIQKMLKK